MEQVFFIILRSLAVYIFIISAIRIFGKREISQLSVIDLVFILLISNSVQSAMVGGNITLFGGLVAASTLFTANYFLGEIFFRSKRISDFIQGEPLMLIYEGKPVTEHLKKAKISEDELEAAIREHGVANISEVNLAVLERDGNISVLSDNYKNKTTKKRKANRIFSREIM